MRLASGPAPTNEIRANAENLVVYDDNGSLREDTARHDTNIRTIELREQEPRAGTPAKDRGTFAHRIRAEPYRRLFGFAASPPDKPLFSKLGREMRSDDNDVDTEIPAGYTYLGQFVFHDLSHLQSQDGRPDDPVNLRSATLDLDSVFDPVDQSDIAPSATTTFPMAVGCTAQHGYLVDLPRTRVGKPLTADRRSDDLLPLAQIHMAVIRFYNAIAALVGDPVEARALCQLHFQSIVLHDYLPRIIDPDVYRDVTEHGRSVIHVKDDPLASDGTFLLPLEFAVACARFGHSMVRNRYKWSTFHPGVQVYGFWRSTFNSGDPPISRLGADWITQWHRLFFLRHNGVGDRLDAAAPPIMSTRIGTRIAPPLTRIPRQALPPPDPPSAVLSNHLAVRTLERAHSLRLNSGQEVAARVIFRLQQCGRPEFTPLSDEELLGDEPAGVVEALTARSTSGSRLVDHTPLWFYTLKEAAVRQAGLRLGPLASRIIMETLHAAIEEASPSILAKGGRWRPDARFNSASQSHYSFPDLIHLAGLAGAPPRIT
jgi:hypothetical protein